MSVACPHYLLFSESTENTPADNTRRGCWRFVLRQVDGSAKLEAIDVEPEAGRERLELLAVVRGLEALDQPSKVTLLTPSRYVVGGWSYGLREWRENGWQWEYYGKLVPVKNRDLWQRLDRATHYHDIKLRRWRLDGAHQRSATPPAPATTTRIEHRAGKQYGSWTTAESYGRPAGISMTSQEEDGRRVLVRQGRAPVSRSSAWWPSRRNTQRLVAAWREWLARLAIARWAKARGARTCLSGH